MESEIRIEVGDAEEDVPEPSPIIVRKIALDFYEFIK